MNEEFIISVQPDGFFRVDYPDGSSEILSLEQMILECDPLEFEVGP